ncbi:MAG: hypothetical protein ABUT11_00730 [Leifsonia sp.]|jgi:hypothetical protein
MDDAETNHDPDAAAEPSALLSRLRVIEDQPLAARAEALAQVHDELRAQLEAGDATRSHA